MMRRAIFRPKTQVSVATIGALRHSDIADVHRERAELTTTYPYEVRFSDVDAGSDRQIEIPVVFYLRRPWNRADPATGEDVVISSMTMQDTEIDGSYRPRSSEFGPEGRSLYSEYRGYAHALPVLAAFLRRRGVKRVWLPDANTVAEKGVLRRHVAGEIYDRTARRLRLGRRHNGINIPGEMGRLHIGGKFFRVNTENYAHLDEHLEAE